MQGIIYDVFAVRAVATATHQGSVSFVGTVSGGPLIQKKGSGAPVQMTGLAAENPGTFETTIVTEVFIMRWLIRFVDRKEPIVFAQEEIKSKNALKKIKN